MKDFDMKPEELESFLLFLNTMGDVVFYPDPVLRDVITLDPQWLVNVFKTLITAEEFMAQRLSTGKEFMDNRVLTGEVLTLIDTGTVTDSCLSALWQGQDVDYLIQLLQKFDLILPLQSDNRSNRRYLVPCMLPQARQGECYKIQFSQNLSMAFKSTHTAEFEELFPLDTFPKLVAACAKIWPIKEDGVLSFRNVSFTITNGVVLSLTQSHRSSITVVVWFNPLQHKQNPLDTVLNARAILDKKLGECRIPACSTADIICPHWTLKDYHVSLVEVSVNQGKNPEPVRKECTCHRGPLNECDITKLAHTAMTSESSVKVMTCLVLSSVFAIFARLQGCLHASLLLVQHA